MEADHELIGKIGHVTGTIEPGKMGEVMVPVRGGSESFYAYASDADESDPAGLVECSSSTARCPAPSSSAVTKRGAGACSSTRSQSRTRR